MNAAGAPPPMSALRRPIYTNGVLAFAALGFCMDGLANQSLGLAIPSLIRDWGLQREAFAPVAAIGLIGVAVGAAAGGRLGDVVGRRAGLIGSLLLIGTMTAASAFIAGLGMLMTLRFLAGIGIGAAIPIGAALVFEFTPEQYRNLAIGIAMTFIPVGGILGGFLGGILLPATGWAGLFLACGLLPILLAGALLVWLPESPRQGTQPPPLPAPVPPARGSGGSAALPGSLMSRDTLALWAAFFFCLLASYTLFSWVPAMLQGQGFVLAATSMAMTAFNLGGMTGSIVSGWLMGRVGSRTTTLAHGLGAMTGAMILGLAHLSPHHMTLTMLTLGLEGYSIGGLHNSLYTIAAHLYPHSLRATGVGAAAGAGRIGAVLSSFTGVLTLKLAGASGYFIVIAAAAALSTLSVALLRRHVPRLADEARQVTDV